MNIKVKVTEGLQGEFANKLGAIYEKEVQKKVDSSLRDVVDEIVEVVKQEMEEMEAEHIQELELQDDLYGLVLTVANDTIESQGKEIKGLKATLEEAETRMNKLAEDKRDLMKRIHELEMDNQRLAGHCQNMEAEAIYAQLAAAKNISTKKADKSEGAKVDPKVTDPKAYESVDSLFKFLFGEVEDL